MTFFDKILGITTSLWDFIEHDPILLLAVLIWIIVFSKVIAHGIKVVDVLMYIILWFFATKLNIIHNSNEIINFLAEIWVIFLMFYAGWHEDSKTFFRKVIDNKWVAIIWAIWPFIWAYLWVNLLWFSFNESVVAWFIFTATAVPYTIAILQSLKLSKTPAAKSIIAAAMADDFISIITMSAVFSTFVLYQSGQNLDMFWVITATWFKLLLLFLCFFAFYILARFVFPTKQNVCSTRLTKYVNLCNRFAFISKVFALEWFTKKFYKVEILVPTVLFILFILSTFSHIMWLHAAIWAYLTWLILHVDMFHSPWKTYDRDKIDHDQVELNYESLTWVIYSLANHFLGPIFFIYLGSQLIIDFANFNQIFIYSFVLFLIIAAFQFITASMAARYTAWLSFKDSVLVGFGMWPRDVLAFVILGIAISAWLIQEWTIFTTIIVVTILFLDIATPLAIKWWSKEYEK